MKIPNCDALIWCENCKGYLPLITKKDYKCPNCDKILREFGLIGFMEKEEGGQ